jgi:nitroreductase
MPGNVPWAKNAAALIVSIAKTTLETDGSANRYAEHDLGAFNATMALQARSMDIITHPMAGFEPKKIKEEFQLDASLKPLTVMALGYLDSAEKLEEPYRSRELSPRNRKGFVEFILNR